MDFRDEENNRYARIYLCCQGCEKKASQALPALYSDLFLTDKKSGKPIEARDLENSTCPVMEGEPVDPKVAIEYNGMIVRFHDPACIAAFLDDPRPGMKRLLPNDKEFEYRRSAGSGSHKHE